MNIQERITRIQKRDIEVGVVGLGYVGLPLSVAFAKAGFRTIAVDVVQEKVDQLNSGQTPVAGVHVQEVKDLVAKGLLRASSDYAAFKTTDTISICVPTPLRKTKDPDISYILDASYRISEVVKKGALVILESTTYPGTTHERIVPIFEEKKLVLDRDVYLAYSPERIDPGNPQFHVGNTPKVVGGITEDATALAAALYGEIVDKIVRVSSTQAAEMVKLLENTFRAVNIGLVNEIAIMCRKLNIDTWEVIHAAASKPFGFMPFFPGPGLGGHCIPVDPHYLHWKLRTLNYNARFIELAGEINTSMPRLVVDLISEALNTRKKATNGAKVLLLGIAYKKDIDDVRESPALDIIELLRERHADVSYHDPFVPSVRIGDHTLTSVPASELEAGRLSRYDCVAVIADHSSFNPSKILENATMLVDTRNLCKGLRAPEGKLFRL